MKSLLESIFGGKQDITADTKVAYIKDYLWSGWDKFEYSIEHFNPKGVSEIYEWNPENENNILKYIYGKIMKGELNMSMFVNFSDEDDKEIALSLHGSRKFILIDIINIPKFFTIKDAAISVKTAIRKHPDLFLSTDILTLERARSHDIHYTISWIDFIQAFINKR